MPTRLRAPAHAIFCPVVPAAPAQIIHPHRAQAPGRSAVLTAAVALLACGQAQAQVSPVRPDAGSVLQQQGSQPPELPATAPRVLPPVFTPKPVINALPSATVSVRSFSFSGNTVFSAARLLPLVAATTGKTATLAELNEAAGAVRQFYRARGYLLAQAYLPRQDVTSGNIEITVLEGTLGRARIVNTPSSQTSPASQPARLRESFAQGVLDAALTPGQLITEAALEQPLLLLSDLPGVGVRSALGAGVDVGSADVNVSLTQNTGLFTGTVDADNQGSRFTGATRIGANLFVNNATGYGDALSVRAQLSADNSRSNFARFGWQIPLGYYGTQAGVSFSKTNYTLTGTFAALRAEGDASVKSAYITHPLLRSRNANLSLLASYEQKEIEDRTLSVNNVETRHIGLSRLALRGNLADSVLGGGLSSFNFGVAGGTLRIDQLAAQTADAAGVRSAGGFSKTNLEATRLQNVTDRVNLLATVTAQWASKNLGSAEKIALGGPNDIRAYPVGEASGDQGYVATLEARYTHPDWALAGASTTLAVFYDFGQVTINKTPIGNAPNQRSLSGAGLGLTLGKSGDFQVRAALAWRTSGDKPLSDNDRSPRFWLQASKVF